MIITKYICRAVVRQLLSTYGHNLVIVRLMANAIPRGQNPKQVDAMPVFQYTQSDKPSAKRRRYVYCWGYSGGGALGRLSLIKRTKFKNRPQLPPIETVTAPLKSNFIDIQTTVTDVAAGFGFTVIAAVVRDSSHRLFGCGINSDSQLGYQSPPTPKGEPLMCLFKPTPIRLPINEKDKVVRVSCGRSHTACLTDKGEVYSLGNNAFGQCGRPIVDNEKYFASHLIHQIKEIDDKVCDIVCGQDHTLFLTESGTVYSCGWGADGQTGLGHYNNQGIPMKVKGDIEGQKIIQLSSAADSVLAINDKGDVFGWGNSEYSQFSSITSDYQLNIPRHLKLDNVKGKVVNVCAGGSICALVNDLGNVYVWGYGILGMGPKVDQLTKPTMLPMTLFGVSQFNSDVKVIKLEASFNHLAAITDKGDLYMWGKNTQGCLGLGHMADQYFPFRVCVPASVRKVSLGIDHTVVIGTSI
ncbi:RCC1-like G exchanging factor-like protein [Oppia nitens]|uniref:RCC1-like G exchanging factor-like protein n=1 Tax=Oppia nitens TaxID=1686743 RepID=UPI0023DB796D|nr:RCC1-like G exchanging factor-like protein [Oppia nitens]